MVVAEKKKGLSGKNFRKSFSPGEQQEDGGCWGHMSSSTPELEGDQE